MFIKAQWCIFICACLMTFGSHFVSHVLSPLKDIIKKNLDLSNTQFGLLQSSELLFQSITPFIGGAITDSIGPRKSSFIATSIFLFGELLMTLSVSFLPKNNQFFFLGLGQLLFGLGAGWIITVLEIIVVQNYSQNSLALAMGSLFAVGKLSGFLATGISVHVVDWTGSYIGIFWFSLIITIFSWIASVAYSQISLDTGITTENAHDSDDSIEYFQMESPRSSFEVQEESKSFNESTKTDNIDNRLGPLVNLLKFDDKTWFYLLLIRVLIGATWTPFVRLSSNIIKHMYHIPEAEAAWQASLALGLPIFLGPIFGFIQDRSQVFFTPQPYFIVFSSLLATLSFWFIGNSHISTPYPSLILFAITLGSGPLALATMAPVLLSQTKSKAQIGLLLGLQSSITHMISALMDTVTGSIQDYYSVNYPGSFGNGYVEVMNLLLVLSIFELLATVIFTLKWFPPSIFSDLLKQYNINWIRLPLDSSNTNSLNHNYSGIHIRKYFYLFYLVSLFLVVWGSYFFMLL